MLSGENGELASPQYPHSYPNNVQYDWTIVVTEGNRVRVSFSAMDMEGPVCDQDYVKVSY